MIPEFPLFSNILISFAVSIFSQLASCKVVLFRQTPGLKVTPASSHPRLLWARLCLIFESGARRLPCLDFMCCTFTRTSRRQAPERCRLAQGARGGSSPTCCCCLLRLHCLSLRHLNSLKLTVSVYFRGVRPPPARRDEQPSSVDLQRSQLAGNGVSMNTGCRWACKRYEVSSRCSAGCTWVLETTFFLRPLNIAVHAS